MRFLLPLPLILALAACGPAAQMGLAPGLTARMDSPGARLDESAARDIVNAYRQTVGAQNLTIDPRLSAEATALATGYGRTGKAPVTPGGVAAMRVSAGYSTFADTFSGWRNSPADAAVLARPGARRAGIGVFGDPSTEYGIYWVLLLAD